MYSQFLAGNTKEKFSRVVKHSTMFDPLFFSVRVYFADMFDKKPKRL